MLADVERRADDHRRPERARLGAHALRDWAGEGQRDVGFLARNVGSMAGFLEEPDISFANRFSRLGRKCREWQVFLG